MVTTATDSKQIISDLSDLIEIDYDAIAAYQSAIEQMDNMEYKAKLTDFLGDHKRHVEELGKVVRNAGGTPPTGGDAMVILTKGKVLIAGLVGDKAILMAMNANEKVTNAKYEEAMENIYPEQIQAVVRRGLADERRHKSWLETTLDKI